MAVAVDIGIADKERKKIADGLSRLLADTYTLYLKTHNYHWNVEGPMFQTLHTMFETQYTELALAVDLIAERIRALGHYAPGSYAQYAKLSSIKEETGVPTAQEMIKDLTKGQAALLAIALEKPAAFVSAVGGLVPREYDMGDKTQDAFREFLASARRAAPANPHKDDNDA